MRAVLCLRGKQFVASEFVGARGGVPVRSSEARKILPVGATGRSPLQQIPDYFLYCGASMDTFLGYPRPGGRAGTRNYLAIIPTVFCANEVVARIAKKFKSARPLLHHQGCAQLKPDVDRVTQTLISLGTNPNVGAVLARGPGLRKCLHPGGLPGYQRSRDRRWRRSSFKRWGG